MVYVYELVMLLLFYLNVRDYDKALLTRLLSLPISNVRRDYAEIIKAHNMAVGFRELEVMQQKAIDDALLLDYLLFMRP